MSCCGVLFLFPVLTVLVPLFPPLRLPLQDPETQRVVFGRSANTDIIVASAQAYLNAVNRLLALRGSKAPTHPQFNSLA